LVACDEVPSVGVQVEMTGIGMRSTTSEDDEAGVVSISHCGMAIGARIREGMAVRQDGDGGAPRGVAGWRVGVVGPVQRNRCMEVIPFPAGELGALIA
jgi:hypothetical protein